MGEKQPKVSITTELVIPMVPLSHKETKTVIYVNQVFSVATAWHMRTNLLVGLYTGDTETCDIMSSPVYTIFSGRKLC